MKLYHCVNARSFRPLWALEEMQLPYELAMLPFPPRVHQRTFLDLNILGTIPLLIDGDVRMTESAAICQYLGDRYGPTSLAVASHEADYGPYLNWLHMGEATLTFPQTLVLRYRQLEPPERRQPQVAEDYRRWFFGRLKVLIQALQDRDYLCAGRFTMADISVGYALMLAEDLRLDGDFDPIVARYLARLKARPAWIGAQQVQTASAEAAGIDTMAPARRFS